MIFDESHAPKHTFVEQAEVSDKETFLNLIVKPSTLLSTLNPVTISKTNVNNVILIFPIFLSVF